MANTNGQLQTGSYAVTTVYSMPWTKKVSKTTTTTTSRKKNERKVVNEIFEKCAEISKDKYWIDIFKGCARERFPRGFQYQNGLLIHRKGNKTVRIEIPNSPAEASSICTNFFKNTAGLMSITDRKRLQKEEEERLLESIINREITWKDIKTERVKELLICDYISDLCKTRNYDTENRKELTTIIKRGFMLKYFTSKNIVMEHNRIIDIEGLIFNEKENMYYIDSKLKNKKIGRSVKGLGMEKRKEKNKGSPIVLWEKYLDNLEKKIHGKVSNFNVIHSSSSLDNSSNGSYDLTSADYTTSS